MLEALLIMSIIYACMFMPLRGKTYEMLSDGQRTRVNKNFAKYMKTAKGRKNPNMTVYEYLPMLQKQGLIFLIIAACLVPLYFLILFLVYPTILAI